MLSRLRKNKDRIHASDPNVRRQAVEALAPDKARELAGTLAELAAQDPDAAVRAACINALDGPGALAPLLDNPRCAEIAARRLADILSATAQPEPALATHPSVLPLLWPKLEGQRALALLHKVTEPDQLVSLCLASRGEVRQAVLERITGAEALTLLERHSRDHDKSLNRHARSALEAIRESRHGLEQARKRMGELLDALDRPALDQPQRAATLYATLTAVHEDLKAHEAALRAAGEVPPPRNELTRRFSALTPPKPIDDAPTPGPPTPDPFPPLVEQFQALDEAMCNGADLGPIKARRQSLTESWLRAADLHPPTAAEHAVFESVSHRYQEYAAAATRTEAATLPDFAPLPDELSPGAEGLKDVWRDLPARRKALKRLNAYLNATQWPDWAKPTAAHAQRQQAAATLDAQLARLTELESRLQRDLQTHVDQLAVEIDAGRLSKASNTLTTARATARDLRPGPAPDVISALNHQAARLAELRDWQTFATSPKRAALCDEIRQAAEHPLDPRDQAALIKSLRSQWNQLGPITKHQDRKLAEEFNRLAEQAFEPCRAYFAEQAKVREANLEQRKLICKQLREYLESTHWASADMKAAEQILRAARIEWRNFHPVDRNPGKKVEAEFEALQGELHQHVKDAWSANLQRKQDIVREAQELVDQDLDLAGKIEQAKSLQQRWKDVGVTPRKSDQKLWQEFRRACDAVFAQRDAARDAADKGAREAVQLTDAFLAELREAVDNATPSSADPDFLRSARGRFAKLPELPPRQFQEAQRRFDELTRRYTRLLDERANAKRLDRLRALQAWDSAMTAFEHARQAGLSSTHDVPDQCFEARLGRTEPPELAQLAEHAVAAELLAGLESPSEDQALRLRLQVDALNAGLGKRQAPPDPISLAEAWCAEGPKCWGDDNAPADARCEALQRRTFAALEQALRS